jgi:ribosomal protein L11 methyltransferase
VSVEDADAQTDAEQALFGEPGMPPPKEGWQRSRVIALFPDEALAREAAALLQRAGLLRRLRGARHRGRARAGLGAAHAIAVRAGRDHARLLDRADLARAAGAGQQVIRLDPGLAFGTGTHPTTRMCLRWIARQGAPPASACSTTAAAPASWRSARPSSARRRRRGRHRRSRGSSTVTTPRPTACGCGRPARRGQGRYDTVLANILATPLKVLAPLLCGHVKPGGSLVLAGILERQADELKEAYAPYAALEVSDTEDGWILMTARC